LKTVNTAELRFYGRL